MSAHSWSGNDYENNTQQQSETLRQSLLFQAFKRKITAGFSSYLNEIKTVLGRAIISLELFQSVVVFFCMETYS